MKKILIANRGEIALRIIRACKDLGIETVAVHSTADEDAMHVRLADESVCIGPPNPRESYLNVPAIISAACITGADAIHPGFGFLSENSTFAYMVEEHGLKFIGPKSEHIALMGDKIAAKKAVAKYGIQTVPGSNGSISSFDKAKKIASEIGFPLLIKAAGGGGGRGMKVVHSPDQLEEAYNVARMEAGVSFGNNQVYIERYLVNPKHIEFQILADSHKNAVHFGERDCSIQRRNQKVWEEALSTVLDDKTRAEFGQMLTNAMSKIGYTGVGTLEFLYENNQFYFIEMNTRIQVEHPVTECVANIDLIKEQILVAQGKKLSISQEDIKFRGHAIECRINAENPETFTPSAGTITSYHCPGGPGVRIDSAIYSGYKIPPYYDSLIAKLIVYGDDREHCLARLKRALMEYVISGVDTLIPLHLRLCDSEEVKNGTFDIHFLDSFINKNTVVK